MLQSALLVVAGGVFLGSRHTHYTRATASVTVLLLLSFHQAGMGDGVIPTRMLDTVVGGVLAWLGAARSVQAELRAALDLARRTTEAAVAAAGGSHPDPAALLGSLRGNRHLRATLLGPDGAPWAAARPWPRERAFPIGPEDLRAASRPGAAALVGPVAKARTATSRCGAVAYFARACRANSVR